MATKNVECEVRGGDVWVKIPDLRGVIDIAAIEVIQKDAKEDNQRERDRLEGQRLAYREIADALTKYEIQMKA